MPSSPDAVIFQLIYESRASRDFSESEIESLLSASRASNERRGITGILLYRHGVFTQVLEGPEVEIRALLEKIGRDPRHAGIAVRLEQHIPIRSFPNWSMAYSRKELSDYLKT
jgi:Sensors of blue-light using FAD